MSIAKKGFNFLFLKETVHVCEICDGIFAEFFTCIFWIILGRCLCMIRVRLTGRNSIYSVIPTVKICSLLDMYIYAVYLFQ